MNCVILIVVPVFFTLLFGYVYSSDYLNNVPMAILDLDNSELSRTIVDKFDNNERYEVKYIVSDIGKLRELIEGRKANIGLFIPPNLEKDVKSKKGPNIGVVIDGVNVAIGNNSLATSLQILNTINAGIDIKLLKAKNVPPNLAEHDAQIFKIGSKTFWDPKLSYRTYMMPGILLILMQQLFLSAFVLNFIVDKEHVFAKALVHLLVGTFTFGICYELLIYAVHMNIVGNVFVACGIAFTYMFAVLGIGMIIGIVADDRLRATQFCLMLSLPSFLTAAYIWPAYNMPSLVSWGVKVVWPLIYTLPQLRDYMMKGVFSASFTNDFISLIIFAIVWLLISLKVLKSNYGERHEQ